MSDHLDRISDLLKNVLEKFSPARSSIVNDEVSDISMALYVRMASDTACIFSTTLAELEREAHNDLLILTASRTRDLTLANIVLALPRMVVGSKIVVLALNEHGARGFQTKIEEHISGEVTTISMRKARAIIIHVSEKTNLSKEALEWPGMLKARFLPEIGYFSSVGIFGWNKIDKGSELLIERTIPHPLSGKGMDLGCGYGYLSCEILKRGSEDLSIVAIDKNPFATTAAQLNLTSARRSDQVLRVDTCNALALLPSQAYDWVVCNPPFHDESHETLSLPLLMLRVAQQQLKSKGTFYVVANHFLPFESALHRLFGSCEILTTQAFKTFICRHPKHEF
jgi:16S rRNA (guanine1207-N2)-methyltransferase